MITRDSLTGIQGTKPLEEVVEFLDHRRRPVTESDRRDGPYPYYGANGLQGYIDNYIFDEPLVLLAEDGGHFGDPDRGIAYRVTGKTWVNNHAHVLRPRPGVDLAYLCRVLETYDVSPFISGTTRGKLTKGSAAQIPIPMPRLEEQRRIAAILDRADDLRRKRRESIERLKNLPQGLFIEMFGNPDTILTTSTARRLETVCSKITDGTHQAPKWASSGVPFIFVSNVRDGSIDLKSEKFVSLATYRELTKTSPIELGDILYTAVGSYGHAAVVRDSTPFVFQRHIAQIKPDKCQIDPTFLEVMLQTKALQRQADRVAKGVAQKTVTLADLKSFLITCPPLRQQKLFSEKLREITAVRELHTAQLKQLSTLFASLQHQVFSGQLAVSHPAPAHAV